MTENYTMHVGEKFHADGSVRHYPGTTIICFADPTSPIYQAGEQLQADLLQQPFGHKFSLLPASSFHMTIFSLILDAHRDADYWSSELALDCSLEDSDQFFVERVATVPTPANFRMCLTYISGRGLAFRLSPADEGTFDSIWEYRDSLSQATGVRYPDHDTYSFHLTLAYNLIKLSDAEEQAFYDWRVGAGETLRCQLGVFDTGMPQLTFFDDMFAFLPLEKRLELVSRKPKA